MAEDEEPVAFIARELWLAHDAPRYAGHVESEVPIPHLMEEGPGWNHVEDAIGWARAHATEVIVRLGETRATMYSAGAIDLPPEPDYPDDVIPRWPPSAGRIREALATLRVAPDSLPTKDRRRWREAAHELGAIRVKQAFDDLVAALASDDDHVVQTAALALVDLGDRRAVEPLAALLESELNVERLPTALAAADALECFDDQAGRDVVARWRAKHGWT